MYQRNFTKNDQFAIVVLSSDRYEVLWPEFFVRLFKNWKTHWDIYLVTNSKLACIDGVVNKAVGHEDNWSESLRAALTEIHYEYVFILLDDIYIKKNINETILEETCDFIKNFSVNYLNTKSIPFPKGQRVSANIRKVDPGEHDRASLVNAFWKRTYLTSLLQDKETPWEFERNGTQRALVHEDYYGTTKPMLSFNHMVIGGQLTMPLASGEVGDFTYIPKLKLLKYKVRTKVANITYRILHKRFHKIINRAFGQ